MSIKLLFRVTCHHCESVREMLCLPKTRYLLCVVNLHPFHLTITLTASKTTHHYTTVPYTIVHSMKKTIKKLGEGVYSEVFYFQEGNEKLVVKVTNGGYLMYLGHLHL